MRGKYLLAGLEAAGATGPGAVSAVATGSLIAANPARGARGGGAARYRVGAPPPGRARGARRAGYGWNSVGHEPGKAGEG
jgi:hypothetical protein